MKTLTPYLATRDDDLKCLIEEVRSNLTHAGKFVSTNDYGNVDHILRCAISDLEAAKYMNHEVRLEAERDARS